MRIKFLKDEDITNYKKISMFIGTVRCTWKCCTEAGIPSTVCQNYAWSKNEIKHIDNQYIIERYLQNPLTEAIVFGGLEPMDQFIELYAFITAFRRHSDDDIVIYTGYYPAEIAEEVQLLKQFKNIIIKYGRYIPNDTTRYDEVLGVTLASSNQYAVQEG